MRRIITTGLCVLALGLAVAPATYANQSDFDQNVETVAILRKKDKKEKQEKPVQDTPANAPATPEKTSPAGTPESNRGAGFVELADVNRPFQRNNDIPNNNQVPNNQVPNNNNNQQTVPNTTTPQNNTPNQTQPYPTNTNPNYTAPNYTNPNNNTPVNTGPTSFLS